MVDLRKNSRWSRMHWTDDKVRHLIQVACYVDEQHGNEKWGKWKSVSELMMEKGFSVSPKQCLHKFHDLRRRCKRLNDLLGIDTAQKVVKNLALLDSMEHVSETTKVEVRKLLTYRPLFYEEIRNYHNRLHIEADLGIQSSTPKSRDDHEALAAMKDENARDDEEKEKNDEVDEDNNDQNDRDAGADGIESFPAKRMKVSNESEGASWRNPENPNRVMCGTLPDNATTENPNAMMSGMLLDNARTALMQPSDNLDECLRSTAPANFNPTISGMLPDIARTARTQPDIARTAQTQRDSARRASMQRQKELKVDIQPPALFEPEHERFKREKLELKRQKLEYKRMKLENERMALQLKQRELEIEYNRSEAATTPYAGTLKRRFQGREQT